MENRVRLDIPYSTILKLLAALLLVTAVMKLWPLMLLLFLSLLLAVTLAPIIRFLQRLIPRFIALPLVGLALFSVVGSLIFIVGPPLVDQFVALAEKLPVYSHKLLGQLSEHTMLRQVGEKFLKAPENSDVMAYLGHALVMGQVALGGLSSTVLVLVFAIYMVADGERTYRWLLAFFPAETREKLDRTSGEVSKVIFAYVAGQVITSTACGVFVFILMRAVGVEQALILGVLAALLDVIPILGFILTILPAIAFALSVSGQAALVTLIGFTIYHAIENYVIVPAVYGRRLRVSTLTVLISLLAGALLAGILGAIAILPVVASYPIIERIWLKRLLGEQVVEKHERIEETAHGPAKPASI